MEAAAGRVLRSCSCDFFPSQLTFSTEIVKVGPVVPILSQPLDGFILVMLYDR